MEEVLYSCHECKKVTKEWTKVGDRKNTFICLFWQKYYVKCRVCSTINDVWEAETPIRHLFYFYKNKAKMRKLLICMALSMIFMYRGVAHFFGFNLFDWSIDVLVMFLCGLSAIVSIGGAIANFLTLSK